MCLWQCFFTSAFNSIDNVLEPLHWFRKAWWLDLLWQSNLVNMVIDSEFPSAIHYRTPLLTKAIIKQSQPCKINMHDSRELEISLEKKVFFVYFPFCWLRRRYVLNEDLNGKSLFTQSLHSYRFFFMQIDVNEVAYLFTM